MSAAHKRGQLLLDNGHHVDAFDLLNVAAKGDCGVLAACTEHYNLNFNPPDETVLKLRADLAEACSQEIAHLPFRELLTTHRNTMLTDLMRAKALFLDLNVTIHHTTLGDIADVLTAQVLPLYHYLSVNLMGLLCNSLGRNLIVYVADSTDATRRIVMDWGSESVGKAVFWLSDTAPITRVLFHTMRDVTNGNWQAWGRTKSGHFQILQPKNSEPANNNMIDTTLRDNTIESKSNSNSTANTNINSRKDTINIDDDAHDAFDDNDNDSCIDNDNDSNSDDGIQWRVDHVEIQALLNKQTEILTLTFDTVKTMSTIHAAQFTELYIYTLDIFLALAHSPDSPQRTNDLRAISLFRHILPSLLLSPDNVISRRERFRLVRSLDIGQLVTYLFKFAANKPVITSDAYSVEDIRKRAVKLCRTPGGPTKVTRELTSSDPPVAPTEPVLQHLITRHPGEPKHLIIASADRAEALVDACFESGEYVRSEHTAETKAAAVKAVISKANYHSAPGPNGLRYAHQQQMQTTQYSDRLKQVQVDEFDLLMSNECADLPEVFWYLHTGASLYALGKKMRPLAIGEVERRLVGATFMFLNKHKLAPIFEAEMQLGVGTARGCEILAMIAQLFSQAGYWIEMADLSNAYNTMGREIIFLGLSLLVPWLLRYARCTHADITPQFLYHMIGGNVVIPSRTGSQQGCPLGSLLFCAGLAMVMRKFNGRADQRGAERTVAYADDMITPTTTAALHSKEHYEEFLLREQELKEVGCELNRRKTVFLAPRGHTVTDADRHYIENVLGATIAVRGAVIAGVPVGDNDFIKEHLENIVNPDVDSKKYLQLANHIAHLPDKQVSLLLMHKCLPSRLIHTARTTSPEHFIKEVGNKSDIINAWVLERIMCIPQTRNITLSQALNNNGKENTIILQHRQQQQLKLPIAKGGLGITSLAHISPAAYTAATAENVKKAISLATINNTNESPAITTNLGDSPLVHDILHSVSMLLDRGVSTSALAAILPAEWLNNNIDFGHTVMARQLTATANTNSGNKCQAKIAALLHTQLLQSYEQSLDKLPSKEAGVNYAVNRLMKQRRVTYHFQLKVPRAG